MLPTSTSKFTAQWQGPYQVLKAFGEVNYLIDMGNRKKSKRIFHVNMLKKWQVQESTGYLMKEVGEEEDEEEILTWDGGEDGKPKMGEQLTPIQKQELNVLLKKYEAVLQKLPGQTKLTEHTINTGDIQPVRLPPYHIPQAYRVKEEEEIKEMLAHKIITPSSSGWAAPMVIVKKKDGSLRICVDYRRLNSRTKVDAYPMPRISDLIDQLGTAKYITTLDLTKGYWQVPVARDDQCKTAFTTPFGLFEFKRTPFGLQGAPQHSNV